MLAALREGSFRTSVEGKEVDPAGSALRSVAGSAYRRLRRAARRISLALPISERTRRRVGRRW